MRLGKALPRSSASSSQYKPIVSCFQPRFFANDRAQPTGPSPTPIEANTNADSNSETPTSDQNDVFKINPESKTIKTAVGELPLSPIMDPTFWEATRRHDAMKPRPAKPINSVERQFRVNPFAQALATPVRMCSMTRTRLPSYFLQDFNLVAHPETGAPWWIPHSLMPEEHPTAEEPNTKEILETVDEAESQESWEGIDVESKSENPQEEPSTEATTASIENGRPHGPAAYILARQDLISAFVVKGSGFDHGPKRITGSSPRYKHVMGKVVWRQDMDTYMLNLMRQDIVNHLLYLSKLCAEAGRYYIVKCYGWDDVKYKHKGAVLWFGEPREPKEGGDSGQTNDQPGPFATIDTQKIGIQGETNIISLAVHNMPMLLGPEEAKRVKEEAAVLRDGSIFMLAGRRSTKLQYKLWRLQGYIADYADMS